MKKSRLFLIVFVFLVGTQTLYAMHDEIPVPITENEEEGTPIIRMPTSTHIQCQYNTNSFSFIICITNNMEMIAVSIERIGTTETSYTELIGNGIFYVPISGNPGVWRITLRLNNGVQYSGEILL